MQKKTHPLIAGIVILIVGFLLGTFIHPRSFNKKFYGHQEYKGERIYMKKEAPQNNQPLRKTYDMGNFEKIILENGLSASITASSTGKTPAEIAKMDPTSVTDGMFLIIVTGQPEDVNNIQIANNDNVLSVTRKDWRKGPVRIEIMAPTLLNIEIAGLATTSRPHITP